MVTEIDEDIWTSEIQKLLDERKLTSHQCIVYSKNSQTKDYTKCGCQRLIQHHSFEGLPLETKPNKNEWNVAEHTKKLDKLICHATSSHKFLRCACENKNDVAILYELMKSVSVPPKLIISVYGGRQHFTMSEDIEKEFMDSLAQAAITSGTWIITSGLNNGAARLIGEGVNRLRALTDTNQSTTILGITWWGNLNEKTRYIMSEWQKEERYFEKNQVLRKTFFPLDDNDSRSLEKNHTHFILLDDGKYCSESDANKNQLNNCDTPEISIKNPLDRLSLLKYPKEMQRSDFVDCACKTDHSYAVTIIVEGGVNTCVAILNDIRKKRPVILIQGSGKIADVIVSLLELTTINDHTPPRPPTRDEIEHNLRRFPMRTRTEKEHHALMEQIGEIMSPDRRRYLNVFNIHDELDLKQTICYAIIKAHFAQKDLYETNINSDHSESLHKESQKQSLLKLAVNWNCFDQATDLLADLQYKNKPKDVAKLFEQALKENRPNFVDYFLRISFDSRNIPDLIKTDTCHTWQSNVQDNCIDLDAENQISKDFFSESKEQIRFSQQGLQFVLKLYKDSSTWNTKNSISKSELIIQPESANDLNREYRRWIGTFMRPIFSYLMKSTGDKSRRRDFSCSEYLVLLAHTQVPSTSHLIHNSIYDGMEVEESIQMMLRDLLYWSIFTERIDMAKVLILHLRTRICAALTCVAILKNRSSKATTSDQRHLYKQQAKDFEIYAVDCINVCYAKNERKACELLIREVPLFGKITCMQVAISSHSKLVINTACFNQVLNRIWYKKLSHFGDSYLWNLKFALSFFTLGLLAPCIMPYCITEDEKKNDYQSESSKMNKQTCLSSQLSNAGVNYYTQYENSSYCSWDIFKDKFIDFHQCPMVKMFYHFLSYIWFLLVFSYMILFKVVPPNDSGHSFHWVEVYIIATIISMMLEDARQSSFFHMTYTRETEQQQQPSRVFPMIIGFFKGLPYILFIAGSSLWYAFGDIPSVFIAAKIILAIDLELWYLWSLRFTTVLKILSPKFFMLRNMVRDLSGFLYLILICIAAYGVASRSMIKSSEITFTLSSIVANIFYSPYWFLYADANDEREMLDNMIANTSNIDLTKEAIATHVLLALHMLLFNVLLLNLLIAVFTTTINKVENNANYFYHYQRYVFIREYFEKPPIPIPPLILICYICMIGQYFWYRIKRCCTKHSRTREGDSYYAMKFFKMIPIDREFTKKCTDFEHAATYDFARLVVEKKKEKNKINNTQQFQTMIQS